MTTNETVAEDAIYFIPRKTIHPDPDQPRVHPDDELQASIDQQGIITPIIVRPHPEIENEWTIIDGERRWRGAASLSEIPCRIRLDLEEPVDRLITQLSANTGKPLSPIEQARAFKKALDSDPKLSQAKLAERLGIPRTTIGDRIRLVEIHPAWMKLIESGHLQVSHAPFIHQYRAVPAEYQIKAAQSVSETDEDYLIRVADMRKALYRAFRDYVIRLDKVSSYNGPVLEIEEKTWSSGGTRLKKVKYAADIKLWRPIRNAAERRRKKEQRASGSHSSGGQRWEPAIVKAVKVLKTAGFDPPLRAVGRTRVLPNAGETVIFTETGWPRDLHPRVLLEKMDPSTITYVKGNFDGDELFTSDAAAVAAAREAYKQRVAEVAGKELAPLRAKLTAKVLADHAVTGAGAVHLLAAIITDRGDAEVVALALGLSIAGGVSGGDEFDDEPPVFDEVASLDAENLLSALAAVEALKIRVPDDWQIGQKIRSAIGEVAFKVTKSPQKLQTERAAAFAADVAKSKKQQKREARAAGKQVGDPSRKNGPIPSLEELEREGIDDHDVGDDDFDPKELNSPDQGTGEGYVEEDLEEVEA